MSQRPDPEWMTLTPKPVKMVPLLPRSRPGVAIFIGPEDISVLDGMSLVGALLAGEPKEGRRKKQS